MGRQDPDSGEDYPELSVVMPIRNEADHVECAVTTILRQDYPKPFELVIAVGPSGDETERVAHELEMAHESVRVVRNPNGGTAAGLNAAIAAAHGDIIARVDGHCELSDGYLRIAVDTLAATGAQVVGGIQDARGTDSTQRAVAAAMSSRFGVGNAVFHYGGDPGPTDTVYLGVFRREAIDRAGGFDQTLVRNQDYELNWRIREQGGTVWFDPSLRVVYRPRRTLPALARQYFEYGQWKREVLRRHPHSLRWRQLAPPAALVANAAAIVLVLAGKRLAAIVPLVYCAAALAATRSAHGADFETRIRMPAAFATMHHAWGAGFLVGPRAGDAKAG